MPADFSEWYPTCFRAHAVARNSTIRRGTKNWPRLYMQWDFGQHRAAKYFGEFRAESHGTYLTSALKRCYDPYGTIAQFAADTTTLLLPIDDAVRWLLWQRVTCHYLL